MNKEEKHDFVVQLAEKLRANPNFYIVDMGGMTVAQSNDFRRKLFSNKLEVHMVKNSLIKKALDALGTDYSGLLPALKSSSSIILTNENLKEPATLIKDYRSTNDKLQFKGALVEQSAYVGETQLDALTKLKTKQEMLGEIVGMLQSPAQNVISALQSGGSTLAGVVQTLSERSA